MASCSLMNIMWELILMPLVGTTGEIKHFIIPTPPVILEVLMKQLHDVWTDSLVTFCSSRVSYVFVFKANFLQRRDNFPSYLPSTSLSTRNFLKMKGNTSRKQYCLLLSDHSNRMKVGFHIQGICLVVLVQNNKYSKRKEKFCKWRILYIKWKFTIEMCGIYLFQNEETYAVFKMRRMEFSNVRSIKNMKHLHAGRQTSLVTLNARSQSFSPGIYHHFTQL